jgi:hypothetical protein
MNTDVRKRLNITENVVWGSQAAAVFNALKGDFMRDVITEMGWLLDQGLPVTVCTPNCTHLAHALERFFSVKQLPLSDILRYTGDGLSLTMYV